MRTLLDQKLSQAHEASTVFLDQLSDPEESPNQTLLIETFEEMRTHFKEIEFFLAYHYPGTAKKLNGPALTIDRGP